MVVVSAVLAIIQIHWTGRLSRSEAERLRVNLRGSKLRQVNRVWTAELTEAWRAIRPSADEVAKTGRNAYAAHYRRWLAHDNPPLFSRVGIEIGAEDSPRLLVIDPVTGRFVLGSSPRKCVAKFEIPGATSSHCSTRSGWFSN